MNDIKDLLQNTKIIAMVGLSNDTNKASNRVAQFMINHGYQIVPVNPRESAILGLKCYTQLEAIPFAVDMVNVFRPAQDCPPIAQSAFNIRAKSLWLQLGISSEEANDIASDAGLICVMDRCLKIELLN